MQANEDATKAPALQGAEAEEEAEEEHKFYMELEKLDEEAIAADVQGKTFFEDLFYLTKDGKPALSWQGVKEMRNIMREQKRPISVPSETVTEKHDHDLLDDSDKWCFKAFGHTPRCVLVCKATAKLLNTGERSPAESEQTLLMLVYDRDEHGKRLETQHYERDPFARQKVVAKAKRNAIRDFIPEYLLKKVYEKWRQIGKTSPAPKIATIPSVGHSAAKPVPTQPAPAASPQNLGDFTV